MLTEEKYQEIAQDTDHSLHFLWFAITTNVEGGPLISNENSFGERKADFLFALRRLIVEGRLKLHRNGEIWEAPVDVQLDAFRDSWPVSESGSGYSDFYVWFIDPVCRPAGVAWRRPDGTYPITD